MKKDFSLRYVPSTPAELWFVHHNHVVLYEPTLPSPCFFLRTLFLARVDPELLETHRRRQQDFSPDRSLRWGQVLGSKPLPSLGDYEDNYTTIVDSSIVLPPHPYMGALDLVYEDEWVNHGRTVLNPENKVKVGVCDRTEGDVTYLAGGAYLKKGHRYLPYDDPRPRGARELELTLSPKFQAFATVYKAALPSFWGSTTEGMRRGAAGLLRRAAKLLEKP